MVGYYNGDLQIAGEVESCYIIAYHFISLIITRGICKKKKKPKLNISYIHEICKMALLLWLNQFCPLKGSSTLTGLHFFILVILPFWSFFSQAQDVTKQYSITLNTTVNLVAGTESHIVAVSNSCTAILDMGSQTIEFFELSNPDGYHLMCEWLLKQI